MRKDEIEREEGLSWSMEKWNSITMAKANKIAKLVQWWRSKCNFPFLLFHSLEIPSQRRSIVSRLPSTTIVHEAAISLLMSTHTFLPAFLLKPSNSSIHTPLPKSLPTSKISPTALSGHLDDFATHFLSATLLTAPYLFSQY